MKRETLMQKIRDIMGPDFFIKTSEEFEPGYKGCIWTSGETEGKDGLKLADYWDDTVHPAIQKLLDRAGWYIEWYDAGTIMIAP